MLKKWSAGEVAVLRTLLYADIFSGTLTFSELSVFLLSERRISKKEISFSLSQLQKKLETKNLVERVYLGEVARHFSEEKWRAITQLVQILSYIPWIESIWITGSIAAQNDKPQDDIDLLFITSKNRLWLTRLFVVSIGLLLGKYRRFGESEDGVQNKWCCNIWLENTALSIFEQRQDIYIAREMIQAIPVYKRWDISAESWLEQNAWIKKWCFYGYIFALQRAKNTFSLLRFSLLFPVPFIASLFNTVAFWLQMLSIRTKQTREEIYQDRVFFHPSNTHQHVVQGYEKMCDEYGV